MKTAIAHSADQGLILFSLKGSCFWQVFYDTLFSGLNPFTKIKKRNTSVYVHNLTLGNFFFYIVSFYFYQAKVIVLSV